MDGVEKAFVEHIKSEHQIKQKKKRGASRFARGCTLQTPSLALTTSWQWPHWLQVLALGLVVFGSTFPPRFPDLGHLQSLWERRLLIQTGDSVALTTTGQFAWLTSAPLASVHALMRR